MFGNKGGKMDEKWKIYEMYCTNCGKKLYGHKDKGGRIKIVCDYCGVCYEKKRESRRREIMRITVPEGTEFI